MPRVSELAYLPHPPSSHVPGSPACVYDVADTECAGMGRARASAPPAACVNPTRAQLTPPMRSRQTNSAAWLCCAQGSRGRPPALDVRHNRLNPNPSVQVHHISQWGNAELQQVRAAFQKDHGRDLVSECCGGTTAAGGEWMVVVAGLW